MKPLLRFLRALPLFLLLPFLILPVAAALAVCDLLWLLLGRRHSPGNRRPNTLAASVVIPNWNGRDLLEKYLPTVVAAMAGNPNNEIIVVDNASVDGSRELLRDRFPEVTVLPMTENLGFGGGSNAGFRAARNDIVVLLNSDMRVEPDFLQPLLDGFTDDKVFSVSCQIYISDPNKRREETGLTQAWWEGGSIRVRHRIDDKIDELYPCFYGGGGSSAYDRDKFLELGGFDELLAPFYMEDTDIGYLAWKRGWKTLYQPKSIVYHEHRGTIGKKFKPEYVREIVRKNFLLFGWKNFHEPSRIAQNLLATWFDATLTLFFGDSMERTTYGAVWRAFRQTPSALASRWQARSLAVIGDTETFRRPMGGYFRDRFSSLAPNPDRLSVLFLSPYPLAPPIHGGAVFMSQTVRELAKHCDVHLVALLEDPKELESHASLDSICASSEFLLRAEGQRAAIASVTPFAVREFSNKDLEWSIHRQLYTKRVDVLQLEYTNMGQYAGTFHRIVNALFEHDVYFQSVARGIRQAGNVFSKAQGFYEYLRALRFELSMLKKIDRIQVCTTPNKDYLSSFTPGLAPRIQQGLRAGIDTSAYTFSMTGREPYTMLFIGNFRHVPNQGALAWFTTQVLPLVRASRPEARLVVAGSECPPAHTLAGAPGSIEVRGFVDDVREPLNRYRVFVCPILTGSGVRVKLLEAFAAGIPVVSTRIGAEGLASEDGRYCYLADDPGTFAHRILELFDNAAAAEGLAQRARAEVEANWDAAVITAKLVESYRAAIKEKRVTASAADPS